MCQSNVYAVAGGREKLLVEEVAFVGVDGDRVTVKTLFGEPLSLTGRVLEIDLIKNRIVLETNDEMGP